MRVRVGNTDAEGRMAMADALYHIKEMALCSVNPHIFTVATLTGHAVRSAGTGYSVSLFIHKPVWLKKYWYLSLFRNS